MILSTMKTEISCKNSKRMEKEKIYGNIKRRIENVKI